MSTIDRKVLGEKYGERFAQLIIPLVDFGNVSRKKWIENVLDLMGAVWPSGKHESELRLEVGEIRRGLRDLESRTEAEDIAKMYEAFDEKMLKVVEEAAKELYGKSS